MKNLFTKLRIERLKRKGYDYYTITVDGTVETMVFYKGR